MVQRWRQFIHERFTLSAHLSMIFVFALAHLAVVGWEAWLRFPLMFVGAFLYLFKLRLYDEVKDYEFDVEHNPERPLARGLVTHREVRAATLICIVLELALFATAGWGAFTAIVFAIAYSLLMNSEFFVKELIRPHLTFYGMIHTVSASLLSLALLCTARGSVPWDLPTEDLIFALICWGVFNVFEIARKTFAPAEEKERVDSYSKVWGPLVAVGLVVSQAIPITVLFALESSLSGWASWMGQGALTLALVVCGLFYAARPSPRSAKVYRGVGQAYIVLVMVVAVIVSVLNRIHA
jgi:4-hydroxybenzoate polyprenyltransferase